MRAGQTGYATPVNTGRAEEYRFLFYLPGGGGGVDACKKYIGLLTRGVAAKDG